MMIEFVCCHPFLTYFSVGTMYFAAKILLSKGGVKKVVDFSRDGVNRFQTRNIGIVCVPIAWLLALSLWPWPALNSLLPKSCRLESVQSED
jgi:hypothetical protein